MHNLASLVPVLLQADSNTNAMIISVGLILAALVVIAIMTQRSQARIREERRVLLDEARSEADRIRKDTREETQDWVKHQRSDVLQQQRDLRDETKESENQLGKREDGLERRMALLTKKETSLQSEESNLTNRQQRISTREEELDEVLDQERENLERIADMTREEARTSLVTKMEREVEHEGDILIQRMVERVKETADSKARDILASTLQRISSGYCQESTVTTVDIASDDMKGRIIGREGRNIRAFEKATGVDVIVDDSPGVITLSCFDPIRREMGGRALNKLLADGRIHPSRIEEVVAEAKKSLNEEIQKTGVQVSYDLDLPGVHPKLVTMLGRLKYRTSYGQNMLSHSVECAQICGMIAAEFGLDQDLAKRCGLFHDIGKAVDHQYEGGHPEIGATILKRFDEPKEVVNSAASHHNDVPQESLYAVLVQAADSVSGSRPGARGESLDRYVERLEKLEGLVNSFAGVSNAQAIQAGREVRVFVNAHKVNDKKAVRLAHEVAKQIEDQLTYPGEIKITLIRETRVVEYAR
ncbi:MAG: ribonuclease Y [Planctomycetes bacterium]|nr:ribonuclease Y [Planctomycetota bacterium]MBT6453214.1 ribonuclease Y [Planctomycetota bacterium]MBT6783883.1 ribonuclease Y [Planctomycetota bacterium]MBT6968266.1 ribonuclease Y [Planctomycetota bacterium]MBT7104853.1 ribonuclease Y [Planctomycetota bacterium]